MFFIISRGILFRFQAKYLSPFIFTGLLIVEDDNPPPTIQATPPPTAYTKHGRDLKFDMDAPLDYNFVTIRADF